jgi:hypothetical protein
LWGTDGTVSAIARNGNTIYVGGFFTSVGPNTGGGAPLDRHTGAPLGAFPRVSGVVDVVLPDGDGGWFVGGSFAAVGGQARSNLAHILVDGRVAEWSPNPDGEVLALARTDQTVYVGGIFSHIGGKARNFVAAVDLASGEGTSWDPSADLQVRALMVHQGRLFVGGDFTAIGGLARVCAAELDIVTGQARSWDPNVGFSGSPGSVRALAASGDTIYIGGDFWTVGPAQRRHLAAVSAATGLATSWNPEVTGPDDVFYGDPFVRTMAVRGSAIYVGGHFTGVGGQSRGCLAQVDLGTALATAWSPDPEPLINGEAPDVWSLMLGDSTIFVSGEFTTIGGQDRRYCAEVGLQTASATPFSPRPNEPVHALAVSGDVAYVGGIFTSIGDQWIRRSGLAAFDAATGAAKDWDPAPDGAGIWSLATTNGHVYVGGDFTVIGGQTRSCLAALDTLTGAATSWNPMANWIVTTMTIERDTLYVGGLFTALDGLIRNRLGAFDLATGVLTRWDPNANSDVYGLAVSGSTVYVAGFFSTIAGESRRFGIAAVDATVGAATDWNPQSDDWVNTVAVIGNSVFVGGRFNSIGGQSRTNLAALDPVTGEATAWVANANSQVFAFAAIADTLYVGGSFFTIGDQLRNGLAALDVQTGTVLPWKPDLSIEEWQGGGSHPVVRALLPIGQTLFVGGGFGRIGEDPTSGLASISFGPPPNPSPPLHGLMGLLPNPVRTCATVRYTLPVAALVTLTVFDIQGRRTATLLDHALQSAGTTEVTINAEGWREGFYFCRLEAGGTLAMRKFVVLK